VPGAARLVAFDLDGTITRGDCVLPFLARVGGRARLARVLAGSAPMLMAARRDRSRRDGVKRALTRGLLRGRTVAAVEEAGARFAAHVVAHRLRPEVVERLRAHQREGDRVVIVTASLGAYARPVGKLLGVDDVLATELDQEDGLLTGELAGANCRGPAKVDRLRTRYGPAVRLAAAYGDSVDDEPMLALADVPHRIGRVEPAPA
jgi:phosphatidylglycerophosphatase C